MELLIGSEKHSLPSCAYVAGFGKSSHIKYYIAIYVLTYTASLLLVLGMTVSPLRFVKLLIRSLFTN